MMEVPPTETPSFSTRTSAWKLPTSCTNLAEARACSPRWLTISNSRTSGVDMARLFSTEQLAGEVTVFAARRLCLVQRRRHVIAGAHARKLDQHGQVHAGDHFDLSRFHDRDREVRGRAAEHVGEDDDAGPGVGTRHRTDDVAAPL